MLKIWNRSAHELFYLDEHLTSSFTGNCEDIISVKE